MTIPVTKSNDHFHRFAGLEQKCLVTFFGRGEAYNYQHGYSKEPGAGFMDQGRLIDGYFKYIYLKFQAAPSSKFVNKWVYIDDIHTQYEDMYYLFQQRHLAYVCNVPGCKSLILIVGHMNAHRKVCVVKSCKNDPKLQNIYSTDHAKRPSDS